MRQVEFVDQPDQTFLGSLNYYSRFIEDFAIYASLLYELREADFHEIRQMDEAESSTRNGKRAEDMKCFGDRDPNRNSVTGDYPTFSSAAEGYSNLKSVTGGDSAFSSAAKVNPNRNSVIGNDPTFSSVAGGDPNCNSVTGAIQRFPVLLEAILPVRTEVYGRKR